MLSVPHCAGVARVLQPCSVPAQAMDNTVLLNGCMCVLPFLVSCSSCVPFPYNILFVNKCPCYMGQHWCAVRAVAHRTCTPCLRYGLQ
jgi:hypothetical protein